MNWKTMTDLEIEKCIKTLCGHNTSVACITQLSDGQLISGSYDSTLKLWDLENGDIEKYNDESVEIFKDDKQKAITRILSHSNGQIIFVSNNRLRVLN